MQAGIHGSLVTCFAGRGNAKGLIQEGKRRAGALLRVLLLEGIRKLQEGLQTAGFGHNKVTEMLTERPHEVEGVEPFCKDFVQYLETRSVVSGKGGVYN